MEGFILGDYLKEGETINTEYKEFCFKKNLYSRIHDYDRKFTSQHQNAIETNLEYYFENIIPKYISSFANTPLLHNQMCNLWIGIDDNGQITGIPTLFNIEERIRNMVYTKILPNIRVRNSETGILYERGVKNMELLDMLKVNVYNCDIVDDFLVDEFSVEKEKHDALTAKNKAKIYRYLNAKHEWSHTISKFCEKMNIISNRIDFRAQMCDYISRHCDNDNRAMFIKRLRDPERFVTPITPIFKIMKNDPNNIYYWIVQWKDLQIQNLTEYRPVPPVLDKGPCLNTYRSRITYHRKRWIANTRSNTRRLKYIVLHLEFHNTEASNNKNYEYYDNKIKGWVTLSRDMGDLGPYCKII